MTLKPTQNTAQVVLFDAEHRILFQHRDSGIQIFPDIWGFFGGGIKEGETPTEGLTREVLEELNYKVLHPVLFHIQPFEIPQYKGKRYIFLEPYNQRAPLQLKEGQGMGWYWISETSRLKTIELDRVVLKLLKERPGFDQ